MLTLTGELLRPDELWRFCREAASAESLSIELSPAAWSRIEAAGAFVDRLVESGERIYGVNTGVGFLRNVVIDRDRLSELQKNLIRSHCCGVGEELPRALVLAMWVIVLNSACRGHRGLRRPTVEAALKLLQHGILGCVPARGSVGASGDLAPSAHAALALIGEGPCTVVRQGETLRIPAAQALAEEGLLPADLQPKEGLSLMNGTQMTTAMAVSVWSEAKNLLETANLATALSLLGVKGFPSVSPEELLIAHGHPGTLECGRMIREWLHDPVRPIHEPDHQQDPYCLRCAPQVHGAVLEEVEATETILVRELNSSADNPLVFADLGKVAHGGNFHAIQPARVCDRLASALTTLAAISERRVNLAMNGDRTGLPHFLISEGGLNSGLMMVQTTAAALVSECRSLSFPASTDSIPTNCDQEDHVSMGPIAALKAMRVAENVRYVLAIELLTAIQAIDLRKVEHLPPRTAAAHRMLRECADFLAQDRVNSHDIEAIAALIESGKLSRC
ncbi:HAL/PAL/TAL family ammonia-lyase [Paludibaculum fermentans]|uniref:Histidine ammonia-lyase n=1 Tax=Paludibaculum fermentans TaxID=1473598 RepID=A0A7S7NLX5_PALFE|nr:histidine ammonia-lyase [Paludibaculum fermentans]QOY86058.1 histidine ammonia-lyase [Paludibaculum fermentans]